MTPEQQRIAIAEWCGWTDIIFRGITDHNDYVGRHDSCRPASATGWWQGPIPDYLNDLNAMHEAEDKLNQEQQESFVHTLVGIIVNPCEVEYGPLNLTQSDVLWMVSFSTAAQRAEALLRTIGKWEEKK